MTTKQPAGKCYLCDQGNVRGAVGHGLSLPGIGMLDVSCPITKPDLDACVAEVSKAVVDMRKDVAKATIGTVSPDVQAIRDRIRGKRG